MCFARQSHGMASSNEQFKAFLHVELTYKSKVDLMLIMISIETPF